jgi:hypothetical protein
MLLSTATYAWHDKQQTFCCQMLGLVCSQCGTQLLWLLPYIPLVFCEH